MHSKSPLGCTPQLANVHIVWGCSALLIPFFGPLNSVMGAFFTTWASYIIPGIAYIWAFRKVGGRSLCPAQICLLAQTAMQPCCQALNAP